MMGETILSCEWQERSRAEFINFGVLQVAGLLFGLVHGA